MTDRVTRNRRRCSPKKSLNTSSLKLVMATDYLHAAAVAGATSCSPTDANFSPNLQIMPGCSSLLGERELNDPDDDGGIVTLTLVLKAKCTHSSGAHARNDNCRAPINVPRRPFNFEVRVSRRTRRKILENRFASVPLQKNYSRTFFQKCSIPRIISWRLFGSNAVSLPRSVNHSSHLVVFGRE